MNSYASIIAWFKALPNRLDAIEAFTYYDSDRKLSQQRNEVRYDLVELMRPSYVAVREEGGEHQKLYRVAFSILRYTEKDDWGAQDLALSEIESKVDDVLSLLYDEADIVSSVECAPVQGDEHDNLWGWAAELTISLPANWCVDNVITND